MEDINIDINSLIVLLQFLGFNINYEPADSIGVQILGDVGISLSNKKYNIKVVELQAFSEESEDQRESLVIPELKENTKKLIHEKLLSILNVISGECKTKNNSTQVSAFRRGSSINISKSFTVNHNVIVNLDNSNTCTSPTVRCSSPLVSKVLATPSRINGKRTNGKNVADVLLRARDLIDLAMEMSNKSSKEELALNSTFTKDRTIETIFNNGPRISDISKTSPLRESKLSDLLQQDGAAHLTDITNTSNISHMSIPKKILNALTKKSTNEVKKNDSIEKKWKRPFSKIGVLKQPSNATGATSIRNSPLGNIKENRVDTPRPFGANKIPSVSNLASPYLRLTPRSASTRYTTPSPRDVRVQMKLTPASCLRKPGWYVAKK